MSFRWGFSPPEREPLNLVEWGLETQEEGGEVAPILRRVPSSELS